MEIVKTSIEGLVILKPMVYQDERGYFFESFKNSFIKENFNDINFIQDNESKSKYGVLRGLHFQKPPFEQTKLVRVIEGEVLDVAVDLRKNSSTYGKHESFILSSENKKQLIIPKGFAHGFVVLSEIAVISYKVDANYAPEFDSGLFYGDENLDIDWILHKSELIISQKDINLQSFIEFEGLDETF